MEVLAGGSGWLMVEQGCFVIGGGSGWWSGGVGFRWRRLVDGGAVMFGGGGGGNGDGDGS